MTRLTDAQLATLRQRPQQTKLNLSIFQPQIIFQAQINDSGITRGARVINYDTVSLGSYTSIQPEATMWIGTTPGAMDIGKIRVRFADAITVTVSENSNIDWQDNLFLTVFYYFELWPVFPRIELNPADEGDSLFYKDYDIPYSNQNSILGTYINMGPHRAATLDPATGQTQLYWTSSGTYNLLETPLSYSWWFQGATITGSTLSDPGYVIYNQPGQYVTRLTVSGTNGATDTSYRYVSIYNDANPPIQSWQLISLNGSRDEGGYTASIKAFTSVPIQEQAVVVIYGENWYGPTKQSLGGNYPNGSDIFFVGHIVKDSIRYDYEHSEVTFEIQSITGAMKMSQGFSVSVESVANPTKWYELLDMDGRRALYHYLRWHTTALVFNDFRFSGSDYKIQFFDSDRESMYDALDNFMRDTLVGQVVADRQGKVWMEVQAMAYQNPTGTFNPVMNITDNDWVGIPNIEERLSDELSFIELGGIAYSGVATGTFSALLASAPGNAPGFKGNIETREGLALYSQVQLNYMAGNIYANMNSPYPTIGLDMSINAMNLDIAPQESVQVNIPANRTIRRIPIQGLYLPTGFDWKFYPENLILLPQIEYSQLVNGTSGETIIIPGIQEDDGFNVPGIQIPPLPILTIPPAMGDAINNAVDERILSYENIYINVGWQDNNYLSIQSGGITVDSASRDVSASPEIIISNLLPGIYRISGHFRMFGSGLTPGDLIDIDLALTLAGGTQKISNSNFYEVNPSGDLSASAAIVELFSISSESSFIELTLAGTIGVLDDPLDFVISVNRVSGFG